jgi:P-type Ca2+ transporter type 2C
MAGSVKDPKEEVALTGLSDAEVLEQRALGGANRIYRQKNALLESVLSAVQEPMFILLLIACGIYFILREYTEALTMLAALFFVAGIDVFQNFRSHKAVKALSRITVSKAKAIRNGETVEIAVEEVVAKDVLICEEGNIIPADAEVLSSNDFSVNESILTGESAAVERFKGDAVMQGTLVVRGYCYARVQAVGEQTILSGIGQLVATTGKEKTPLQLKVSRFVQAMVIAGSIAFGFVWIYYWWESGNVLNGLLHGLTMAMSVLPEEIPVALSTFMALGAYRMLKLGIIARSPRTVETLGSATVICLDKTGTLTQNLMQLARIFEIDSEEETVFPDQGRASEVLAYAMWASEEHPFDPMEISIHEQYGKLFEVDERENYRMAKEYPLGGHPPVMTHIYHNHHREQIISCKGGLEGVLKLCALSEEKKAAALRKGVEYAQSGYRVLGVAKGHWDSGDYPERQEDIPFQFLGIIAFYDPPASNISKVIQSFYQAGVDVKMITGDYKETALALAQQTGIKSDKVLTGQELEAMSDAELEQVAPKTHIFARIRPEAKLRIINALKQSGEIVSMTGDGVNDAPALKAAHIGIAMGKRGTEVAKGAAGLILAADDLSKMTEAIFLGRQINENLSKAIRYIISIHIPIILLVLLPIFFPWLPSMLFSPIHVIFLELIMGPTCSVIYENEPVPQRELRRATNSKSSHLFKSSELGLTILQGLMITAGCLWIGHYASQAVDDELKVRTYIFSTLILSNIFLTLVNRSFTTTILQTIRRKNRLIPFIIALSALLLALILNVPGLNELFKVSPLSLAELALPIAVAFASTMWVEPFKAMAKKV